MAVYNVPNWGYIAGGAAIRVGYLLNGGQDDGAQWAQANPEDSNAGLLTSGHGMLLNPQTSKKVYYFDLKNEGPGGTRYALDGGSVGN
jgi:hypothetical protein